MAIQQDTLKIIQLGWSRRCFVWEQRLGAFTGLGVGQASSGQWKASGRADGRATSKSNFPIGASSPGDHLEDTSPLGRVSFKLEVRPLLSHA